MSLEHDITKKILNTIRERTLTEQNESSVISLSDNELQDQQKKFQEQAVSGTEFKFFKIYPNARNVVFSGTLDSGIDWQYSKVDDVFFNVENMQLTDEVLEDLRRLRAYYINWKKEWDQKLNEYIGNTNGEV